VIFFRRRNKRQEPAPEGAEPHDARPTAEDDRAPEGSGPWDLADQPELGKRVDVGALRVPARQGMQMRMELEPKTRRIVAVNVVYQGSAVQLQAFAAPRSQGIWEELREEITESIGKQGGSVEEILQDVVVVRGDGPRPPRELLPLHLPGKPGEQSAPARPTLDLDSGRGPEITEVG